MPHLTTKLNRIACAVAIAFGTATSAQAITVLEQTGQFEGAPGAFNFTTYGFSISTPGTYLATLIDTGVFTPFDPIGLGIIKNGGDAMGSRTSPGSFTFEAVSGAYTAVVAAYMGSGTFPLGSYSVSVSLVPEPETWAMMLVGMGLVGWQLRRKVKASAASRFV